MKGYQRWAYSEEKGCVPFSAKYQDMKVKKGEFQIIGKVVEKKKRY